VQECGLAGIRTTSLTSRSLPQIAGSRYIRIARGPLAAHADELEGYETSDEHRPNSNLVHLEFEMLDREPDEEFVEAVAEEMVRLIQYYHPKLVKEVGPE
jgi:hypothetical protein